MIGDEVVADGVAANTTPVILLGDGAKLAFNNTTYRLDGNATLNGIWNGANHTFSVFALQTLTIGENSMLTLPTPLSGDTVILHKVTDSSSTPRVLGETGAKIVLEAKGFILFYESDIRIESGIGNKTWNNFYSTTTDKEAANYLHGKTYEWSTALGSESNASGWKKKTD
jgi:hypothetical protein